MIRIKRTYEPAARTDGHRFLVERLWPRGLKKEKLGADWVKEVAPSTGLRLWFGHRIDRWEEFQRRYRAELDDRPGVWRPLRAAGRRGTVTLLYSARDVDHNSAVVLRDYLQGTPQRVPRPSRDGRRRAEPVVLHAIPTGRGARRSPSPGAPSPK